MTPTQTARTTELRHLALLLFDEEAVLIRAHHDILGGPGTVTRHSADLIFFPRSEEFEHECSRCRASPPPLEPTRRVTMDFFAIHYTRILNLQILHALEQLVKGRRLEPGPGACQG